MIETDVVAIGAGQASVPFVRAVAKSGRSAVLVEHDLLGGSCVNFGCTPSKAALACAQHASDARNLARFGVTAGEVFADFTTVMARARGFAQRARAHLDEMFAGSANPRLVRGHARLWAREGGRFRVVVDDGPVILASRVVLDTGTRSIIPPIPGLDAVQVITAETWLDLECRPSRLIMLGSGAVGLEMAQFYRRLGVEVIIVERERRILSSEDEEVSDAVHAALVREGILIVTSANIAAISSSRDGVHVMLGDAPDVYGSHIFVAAGRRPAIEHLGLDSLGLAPVSGGALQVDELLETSIEGIYAAGDIRGGLQFTQTAWDDHRILLGMFPGYPPHTTRRVAPYAIFTDPEVARVGLDERAAVERDISHHVGVTDYSTIAKAREIGRERGFIKLICDESYDKLLGATIVGTNAGELIHVVSLLMQLDAPLDAIRSGIFVHPTLSEGVQSAVVALLDEREAA